MLKAFKYRIYPTESQVRLIEKTIGCCRLVYNLALQVKMESYKAKGIKLSAFDLCRQLTEMKKDYLWMQEVDSQALKASIIKVDNAFRGFFRGNGYPKFKNKSGRQSFQCQCGTRKIDWENSVLTIPKIRDIPVVLSRKIEGEIKSITISRVPSGKYFASVLVDNRKPFPLKQDICESTTVGIDLGIKSFLVTSSGVKIDNPKYLKNKIHRVSILQRRLRNKKKGSNNKRKAQNKVSILHEKISNQRFDFLHKLSTRIVNNHDTIAVENLAISNMIKNRTLAQSISDAGWGMFVDFCKYKSTWYGKNVIEIGTFYPSTKICSFCGAINHSLTLVDREWGCLNCNTQHDRDTNAAINIKSIALKNSGWGTSGEPVELLTIVKTKKQEITVPISGKRKSESEN